MNATKKMPYTHIHISTNRLIQSILQIDRLPNIPAHNWTTKAAQALSPLHSGTTFGVAIIHLYATSNRFEIESSDIHPSAPKSPYSTNLDNASDALDRLGAYPVHIPKELRHLGYIAPISQLYPLWSTSKAGDPWAGASPHQTMAGYAPVQIQQIDNHTNNSLPAIPTNPSPQTTLGLLVFARPNNTTDTPINPAHFSAALSTMAYRAASAFGTHQSTSIPWLTQREQTILDLLAKGLSVREIAESIERSHHTVHDHVKNLHKKIGASSRGELVSMTLGNETQHSPPQLISPIIDPLLIQQSNTDPFRANAEIKLTKLTALS